MNRKKIKFSVKPVSNDQRWYFKIVPNVKRWLLFRGHLCYICSNGTMSADIFQHKMVHAIQLKWTFLALKWAVFCLKIVFNFSKKATPANSKQNLNIMQL